MEIIPATSGKGVCELIKAGPSGFIIFGASGDLTEKKLIPSLFNLYRTGNIPQRFFMVGCARTAMDDSGFRKKVEKSIKDRIKGADSRLIGDFITRCYYIAGDYADIGTYNMIKERAFELAERYETGGNLIFNYATPPSLFGPITEKLGESGLLVKGMKAAPYRRIMVEKPFGRDLSTAQALNAAMMKYADDSQIYRIDHYLGKNTVQNIIVFRFANSIFEPVWNNRCIDHVQITVAEEDGAGGRAGYFEQAGLIRDLLQNHMLQLMALVAMDEPASMDAEAVRDEKAKVFRAIKRIRTDSVPDFFLRGQYAEGMAGGARACAYRQEQGVDRNSCVETFFAAKLFVDNARWEGVPFYFRAGKRLSRKRTAINVVFKRRDDCLFCKNDLEHGPNVLTFGIQPEQGVSLKFTAKVPGSKMCLSPLDMKFNYDDVFGLRSADDYETVILDCMNGDQTIFWRRDGVEEAWGLLTPVLHKWETCPVSERQKKMLFYPAGSEGPAEADEFIRKDGREWI